MKKFVIGLFLVANLNIFAQNNADFLIIENPKALTIYNKYKQPADKEQIAILVPFKPLLVKKREGVFNDGVRGFSEIDINNNSFYILKEKGGEYYNKTKSGKWLIFYNSKTYYDTIKVTEGNKIVFHSPLKDDKTFINKGESVVRIFDDGNLTYAKINSSNKYGWAELKNNSKFWERKNLKAQKQKKIDSRIKDMIIDRFNKSNEVIKKLYVFMNNKQNKKLPPPKWKIKSNNSEIIATLTHSFSSFSTSHQDLANKLENMLIGTGLKLKINADNIRIGF